MGHRVYWKNVTISPLRPTLAVRNVPLYVLPILPPNIVFISSSLTFPHTIRAMLSNADAASAQ